MSTDLNFAIVRQLTSNKPIVYNTTMTLEREARSPNNKEVQKAHRFVQIISQAGYTYDMTQTHNDYRQRMHFSKRFDKDFYPHFHLIINPDDQFLNIYVEKGKHKASYLESELPREIHRLREFFTNNSQSIDERSTEISGLINQHLTAIALFGVNSETHKDSRKKKLFKRIGFHKDRNKTQSKRMTKGGRFKL